MFLRTSGEYQLLVIRPVYCIGYHCLAKFKSSLIFSETYNVFDLNLHLWRLYAGEYNISKDDPNEQYYRIRRVLLHPGYNATSLENDIALVITDNVIM